MPQPWGRGPLRSTGRLGRRQEAEVRPMGDRESNEQLLPKPPTGKGHAKKAYGTFRLRRGWLDQRVHQLQTSAIVDPSTRPLNTMPRETEELLQGSAQDQQRLEAAERRALDVVNAPSIASECSSTTDVPTPRSLAVLPQAP